MYHMFTKNLSFHFEQMTVFVCSVNVFEFIEVSVKEGCAFLYCCYIGLHLGRQK